MSTKTTRFTAFEGLERLASGSLADLAVTVKERLAERPDASILVFDDRQGRVRDLDLRGANDDVRRRYQSADTGSSAPEDSRPPERRGRGRPKLGVTSREVTLLPRHWHWLATQPGGASAALRRLVEDARKSNRTLDSARAARDAAYRVMSAIAGDLPDFEEASRALFAGDRAGFEKYLSRWPASLGAHLVAMAFERGDRSEADEAATLV